MHFIDTHCHMHMLSDSVIDTVIKNSLDSGIEKMLIPGVSFLDFQKSVAFTAKYNFMFPMLGVHPSNAKEFSENEFVKLLKEYRPFMIGEIGLDKRYEKEISKEIQEQVFETQLGVAIKENLPVSLHIVGRDGRALEIISKFPGTFKGIMHGFTGKTDTALRYIKKGLTIGIGPMILNENSKHLRETVCNIEIDNIVAETDAPFLWYLNNGLRSIAYPDTIEIIIAEIAHLKGISVLEAQETIYQNSLQYLS